MAFSGIPLPKTVADTEAGGGIVQGMNALNNYELNRSNAQYAPYTNYANAASKMAYSNFVGPQAIASILTNPATRGMFTQDQYNTLAKAFSSQVQGSGNALANLPPPQGNLGIGGMGRDLLNKLMSIMHPGSQSQNALTQPVSPTSPMQNNANSGMRFDNQGNNIVASPEEIQNIANRGSNYQPPSSQIDRTAQSIQPQGAMGGYNPSAVTKAQEQALEASATTEAKGTRQNWTDRHIENGEQAKNAQNVRELVHKFDAAYDELEPIERGPYVGKGPALSDAAQTADTTAQAMADAVARAQQQGHITQMDRATYGSMKPGRFMGPGAKKDAVNFMEGLQKRTQEHQTFDVAADKKGLTPQEADEKWIKYISEKPFMDYKDHKLLNKNMNQWKSYLNKGESPENATNESQVEGHEPPAGTVWMMTEEGDKVPVHTSKIDEAKKRKLKEIS